MQEGMRADLVNLLNMAATNGVTPLAVWHTYEGNPWESIPLTARYVDPAGISTLELGDPIRNIKAPLANGNSVLFYPGQRDAATWEKLPAIQVWQVGLYMKHNGQIVITASGNPDYLLNGYGQILDGCNQE